MSVPSHFNCPLGGSIMRDPVKAQDGHTYERNTIEAYIRKHGKSPKTGESMLPFGLKPNLELVEEMKEFFEKNPSMKPSDWNYRDAPPSSVAPSEAGGEDLESMASMARAMRERERAREKAREMERERERERERAREAEASHRRSARAMLVGHPGLMLVGHPMMGHPMMGHPMMVERGPVLIGVDRRGHVAHVIGGHPGMMMRAEPQCPHQ